MILTADPSLDDLYLAYSDGPQPEIHAANRVVNLFHTRGRKPVTVVLNATVPWDIAARGGVSHVDGDLRGLQLRSLSVGGGASGVELTLGLPSGTVPIEVTGGISRLTIHRPAEAAVRVEGRGGVSRLTFDQRRFGGAGELTVQSPGFDRMTDRYAVRLTGGVSRIVIDMAMPPETPNIAAPSRSGEPVSLRNLPAAEYPNIAALGGQIMSPSMDELFRFGMTIILDGLELRLENRSAT